MGIENVKMFPAALRRGFDSVFTSEDNITGIVRAVTDKDSYIIKLDNTTPVKFVIHGYYFELANHNISNFTGDKWAAIKLDSSNRLVRYSNGSTVLDENGAFEGLEIADSQPTNSDGSYKVYSLQLTSSGVAVANNFSKLSPESIQVESNVNQGSTKPVSGDAVYNAINSAINNLDVGQAPATISDSNYIKAISELNGKISAAVGTVSSTYDDTSLLPISGKGVAAAIKTLDSSIATESNKAISSITIADGKINGSSKITIPTDLSQLSNDINNVTGTGTSGYLAKFNGNNSITNGPQLGSGTTTFLRNDGSWATPHDTTYSSGTGISISTANAISNTGVRSVTINGNYLKVNTGGTDNNLTIAYATSASSATKSSGVVDSGDSSKTCYLAASQALTSPSYYGVWDGYTLKYIAASNVWDNIGGGAIGKKASLSASDIPDISGAKITSGTVAAARIADLSSTYKTVSSLKSKGGSTTPVYFDSNGNAVACTAYSSASVNYATSAGSATSATSASSATKATNDGDGNKISTTYLKLSAGSSAYNSWGFKRIVAQSSAPGSPTSGDIWIKI